MGNEVDKEMDELEESLNNRIEKAIKYAVDYGGIDGAHHKDWTIDQIVRALTGCPNIKKAIKLYNHDGSFKQMYEIKIQGESEEYKKLVVNACDGEDGPNTYDWDCGIAP
jgi:hypothetical protein